MLLCIVSNNYNIITLLSLEKQNKNPALQDFAPQMSRVSDTHPFHLRVHSARQGFL